MRSRFSQNTPTELLSGLTVCGYECKVFYDDKMFASLNVKERQLIPWQGDEKLMIDRYDVRALLDDKKLFTNVKEEGRIYKATGTKKKKNKTKDERREKLEAKMNKERYWDMMLHQEDLYKGTLNVTQRTQIPTAQLYIVAHTDILSCFFAYLFLVALILYLAIALDMPSMRARVKEGTGD